MKYLPLILLLGCSKVVERDFPQKIVEGVRYAFVAEWGPPFVIYANGSISPEFFDCMWPAYHPRKVPLPPIDEVWTHRMVEWEERRQERIRRKEIAE